MIVLAEYAGTFVFIGYAIVFEGIISVEIGTPALLQIPV
jgi:hypothetical protein